MLRPEATETDIRWVEFVWYVVGGGHKEDEHWSPYLKLCHPCAIKYDYIAKYETLEKDAQEILSRISPSQDQRFPHYQPSNTSAILRSYMETLTDNLLDQLYLIYKDDFELFQYTFQATHGQGLPGDPT
ncbi:carbohydrate sulfotransferase 11-like [Cherax quadricarinatus]|uniref:carbohydrate sulfotransferase 11-like n=1 Tax=Cherax quadricarinatus TaxID=27406 RepID=UPI00387E6847